jgi:hypothetical protein
VILMTHKGGRPKLETHSYENLLKLLLDYRQNNPDIKVKLKDLERQTGVKAHIWRDNSKIREHIEEMNKIDLGLDYVNLEQYRIATLPSIEEIVEANYNNRSGLIKALQSYDDFMKKLYEIAFKKYNEEKCLQELKQELENARTENNLLRDEAEYYKSKYFELCVSSKSTKSRKDKGIKDNVIKLNKDELNQDFDSLFQEFNLK